MAGVLERGAVGVLGVDCLLEIQTPNMERAARAAVLRRVTTLPSTTEPPGRRCSLGGLSPERPDTALPIPRAQQKPKT